MLEGRWKTDINSGENIILSWDWCWNIDWQKIIVSGATLWSNVCINVFKMPIIYGMNMKSENNSILGVQWVSNFSGYNKSIHKFTFTINS